MRKIQPLFFFLALPLFIFSSIFSDEFEDRLISSYDVQLEKDSHMKGWSDDLMVAKKEACRTNKLILLAFLGPNWCKWSDALEADILTHPAFIQKAKKNLILVKVDLPEDFSNKKLPPIQLTKCYRVDKCPSLLLLDQNGKEIIKIDYLPLNCKEFAAYIEECIRDFRQIARSTSRKHLKKLTSTQLKTLYGKAAKLSDGGGNHFRKLLLDAGVKKDKGAYFLVEKYSEVLAKKGFNNREIRNLRKKILKRDPDNLEGAQFKLALLDFKSLSEVIKTPQKPESVVKPLVDYLKAFGHRDQDHAWRLEMMISEYLFGQDQIEEALSHARACLKIAPESEKKEIEKSIHYLQTKTSDPVSVRKRRLSNFSATKS